MKILLLLAGVLFCVWTVDALVRTAGLRVKQHPYSVRWPMVRLNYTEAVEHCETALPTPHHLVEIHSDAENIQMYEDMQKRNITRMWIGLTNNQPHLVPGSSAQWKWGTGLGKPVANATSFWGPKEPNNFRRHNERCGAMRVLTKNTKTRNWNDAPCNLRLHFACKKGKFPKN